jgi:hypothetical protein
MSHTKTGRDTISRTLALKRRERKAKDSVVHRIYTSIQYPAIIMPDVAKVLAKKI